MKKIGVLLSGCGVYDGSEIHESVLTLLAICKNRAQAVCIAPDISMVHTIDHSCGEERKETRNVLVEAARISRGNIVRLSDVNVSDLDALILPGGFGAAKNLCDYAFNGSDCNVHKDVAALITKMADLKKPVGAICIAPVIIAKVLGSRSVEVTIGTDEKTAGHVESFGAKHVKCEATECHFDEKNKVVTVPAYMNAANIGEVSEGIEKLVQKIVEIA
jgi:enhancing lycopene biosynthesis protein 2